jgi:amino acid transporter
MSGGVDAVKQLADATALLLLCSFMVVNTSLIVLKRRPGEPAGHFEVPIVVPALGVLVNATLIIARITSTTAGGRALAIAGVIMGGIVILYFIVRPKNVTEKSVAAVEEAA